jgi:hypothetical protein
MGSFSLKRLIEGIRTAVAQRNADVRLELEVPTGRTPELNVGIPWPIYEHIDWPKYASDEVNISRSAWAGIVQWMKENGLWGSDVDTLGVLRDSHPFFTRANRLFGPALEFCPSSTQTSKFMAEGGVEIDPASPRCKSVRITFALLLLTSRLVTSEQWLDDGCPGDGDPSAPSTLPLLARE